MTEEDIHQLIEQELRESSNWAAPTKPEILSRLVRPRKMPFLVDMDWNHVLDLWLVYENTDDGFEFRSCTTKQQASLVWPSLWGGVIGNSYLVFIRVFKTL